MHDPDLRKNFGSRSTCCEGDLHALRETAGDHKGLVKIPRIFLALPHSTTLAPNEFFQSKRVITPIGMRASPAFCRDKGRMRRWVGAWCLSWWQRDPLGTAWSTQAAPQRGQAQGPLIHPTPPLVLTGRLTSSAAFGRQHSLGFATGKFSDTYWPAYPQKRDEHERPDCVSVGCQALEEAS